MGAQSSGVHTSFKLDESVDGMESVFLQGMLSEKNPLVPRVTMTCPGVVVLW